MPYDIVKVSRDGYKVCKPDSKRCFSKKPLSMERAQKQQAALYASEQRSRGRKLKSLESQPTGQYKAIISANADGDGSDRRVFEGSKREVAAYLTRFLDMPVNHILNSIPEKGVQTFGQPIKVVVMPANMSGAGVFDWLKKKAGQAVEAVKSGLSKVIDNVSNDKKASTELGDDFMKAQTKLFSPSGREDEPGIPPAEVIQNFKPNIYMPETKILYQMNKNAYDNVETNVDPGWVYMTGTPTLKLYNNGPAIMIAVRGTADQRDIITDLTIAAQDMENQQRYKDDKTFIQQFQVNYPAERYTYLLTGHSLGGAICDQLMADGIGLQAITFNPAVQKRFYDSQNNKRIYQAEDPLYRMMGRYCKYNVEVRTNRAQSALEVALSYVPYAGVGYTAMQAHSLSNYVGGMWLNKLPSDVVERHIMPKLPYDKVSDLSKASPEMQKAQEMYWDSHCSNDDFCLCKRCRDEGGPPIGTRRPRGGQAIPTSIEDRPHMRTLIRPF